MGMTIHCDIVTQEKVVFTGDVDIVIVPGADGEMGILPSHSPLLTSLQFGIITVRLKGSETHFTVAGGVAEVQPDQVTILADVAENVEEIDIKRAEDARKRAEVALKNVKTEKQDEYLSLRAALNRSNLRLDAVRRYRQGQNLRNQR
jgi:F-type H+-transporting ATPase subunit epsilon